MTDDDLLELFKSKAQAKTHDQSFWAIAYAILTLAKVTKEKTHRELIVELNEFVRSAEERRLTEDKKPAIGEETV